MSIGTLIIVDAAPSPVIDVPLWLSEITPRYVPFSICQLVPCGIEVNTLVALTFWLMIVPDGSLA